MTAPWSRPSVAAALALLVVPLGLLAQRCIGDPAIPFLVQDDQAPWMMAPLLPTGLMGLARRDALPVTSFVHAFELPPGEAPAARLRLRALRSFELWVNGERVATSAPDRHWRRFREIDLAGRLRPGANELRVDVRNPTGPAMLSLSLEGLDEPLSSARGWSVRAPDGAAGPAVRTHAEHRNPSGFAMPSAAEGLRARRDLLLLAAVASTLLSLALGRPRAAGLRRGLRRSLPWWLAGIWLAVLAPNALQIPIGVGFDAHHHVAYVEFLREHRALPLATDGWSMFHPPAYYALTALLVTLTEGWGAPALGWKLPGLLSGLAAVLLCGALARRLLGAGSREAVFAALLAAVLPMNLTLAAYVTNESLHGALVSALSAATVALLLSPRPGRGALAGWGVLVGLAVLAKYTAWIVAAVAGACLAVRWAVGERLPLHRVAARLALPLGIATAGAGWFYLRNWVHLGEPFPLNVDLPGATQVWWSQPGYYTPAFFLRFGEVLGHPFLAGFHSAWDSFYSTLWGDGQLAGQVNAAAAHPYWDWELMAAGYWLALPASLLAALGAALGLGRALGPGAPGQRAAHAYLLLVAWALLLAVLYMTLRQPDYGQAKAFYAIGAMAPLAVFFGLGCGAVDRWLESRAPGLPRSLWHGALGAGAAAFLLAHAG